MDVLETTANIDLALNHSDFNFVEKLRPLYSRVLQSLTMAVISLTGILGNSLVLAAVIKCRKLRTPANVFVANLALTNGFLCVLLVFSSPPILLNRNLYEGFGCTLWGYLIGTGIITANFTLACIAVNRYRLIANIQSYKIIFSMRRCVLISSLMWVLSLGIMSGTLTPISGVDFNTKTDFCSYRREGYYMYILLTVGFGIPLVIVCGSYTVLYITVRKSRKRIQAITVQESTSNSNDETVQKNNKSKKGSSSNPNPKEKERRRRESKLTWTLFTIFVVYIGMMGPYFLVNMVDRDGKKWSAIAHKTATWIAFATNAVNPIIYALINEQFRVGYKIILKLGKNNVTRTIESTIEVRSKATNLNGRKATKTISINL